MRLEIIEKGPRPRSRPAPGDGRAKPSKRGGDIEKTNLFNRWGVPALAAALALITHKAFFPGFMSPDSYGYLDQGRMGIYDDMHAPGMSIVWGLLLSLWDNPGTLFAFHTLLYWATWAALAVTVSRSWKIRFLILLTAVLPPLWSQITVVWADSELSLFLMDAYLLGLWVSRAGEAGKDGLLPPRIFPAASALALFLFSGLVRTNALPALVPLAFFLCSVLFPRISKLRALGLAALLCALGLGGFLVITRDVLHSKRSHPYQLLLTYDIAGVFARTGDAGVIPDYWKIANPKFTPELLLKAYTPLTEVPLSFQDDSPVYLTRRPESLEELGRKWRGALLGHTREFLAHRWAVFKRLLGIGEPSVYEGLYFETATNLTGIRNQGVPSLQEGLKGYFRFFQDSLLFRGWFYLFGLTVLVIVQWRTRGEKGLVRLAAACSCLSGFLYGIAYIAYPPSAEFRFLYPTVSLFFLSLILTLAGSDAFRTSFDNKRSPAESFSLMNLYRKKRLEGFTAPENARAKPPKPAARVRRRPSR